MYKFNCRPGKTAGKVIDSVPTFKRCQKFQYTSAYHTDLEEQAIYESPEEILWFRVLLDGIQTAIDPSVVQAEHWINDYFWLFHSIEEGAGSFSWICDHLGIDSESLRARLWRERKTLELKGSKAAYHARTIRLGH